MNEINPASKTEKRSSAHKPVGKVAVVLKEKEKDADSGDKVTLSQTSRKETEKIKEEVSPEIRQDIVNKYRNYLQRGTYVVKADEIADKIIQKIRESKNHHLI